MSTAPAPPDAERPVFLLSATWRCGSTLLQRLLSSSDELFVWGETAGMLERLRAAAEPPDWFRGTQERHLQDFERDGLTAWIPNIGPPAAARRDAMRAFLLAYYESATREIGRRRWGLKEVRYGADDARLLLDLFPAGRVVFLLRHPVDVLASISRVSWPDSRASPEVAAEVWTRHTREMLAMDDERCVVVRHEDVVAEPVATLARLADHVGVDPSRLDLGLAGSPVGAAPGAPSSDPLILALVADDGLREAARLAGYDVDAHPLVAGAGRTERVRAAWLRRSLRATRR